MKIRPNRSFTRLPPWNFWRVGCLGMLLPTHDNTKITIRLTAQLIASSGKRKASVRRPSVHLSFGYILKVTHQRQHRAGDTVNVRLCEVGRRNCTKLAWLASIDVHTYRDSKILRYGIFLIFGITQSKILLLIIFGTHNPAETSHTWFWICQPHTKNVKCNPLLSDCSYIVPPLHSPPSKKMAWKMAVVRLTLSVCFFCRIAYL